MVAESGAVLLDEEARRALVERLLPLTTVATPNIPEARVLTGLGEGASQEELARGVLALGPKAVVVTGGHSEDLVDLFFDGERTGRDPRRAPPGRRRARFGLHPLLGVGGLPGPWRRAAGGRARHGVVASEAVGAGLREIGPGRGPSTSSGWPLGRASSRFRCMSTNGSTATKLPRPRSATVFDGPDRAHSRAYMKGIGFDDDALSRPTIGIANTWTEAMPCNFHLRGLAEHVKEGVRAAGGTPMEFNTVAVSDGVTMGTQGMKASLISREVIADSIELMARGYQFDAIVALCACDKTIPGCAMALARLDVPSVLLYGGSIAPGHWHGRDVTILDVFEAIGAHNAGDMSDEELNELEGVASPGAGACGGQFTANTMACAFEALGISAGGSAMVPAEDDDKATVAEKIGELVIRVLAEDITPSKVITRDSLENAIACVCASGGSTNGVLHLIALAHELGIELTMDDFERISRNDAAARRPQAGRALRRHRPLRGRAACR